MVIQSALIQAMVAAIRKACKGVSRDFGEISELQVSRKGPGDFVTAADKRVEAALFEELTRLRPGYGFLGEEQGLREGTDKTHRWIVDPIDGTTNFMHGIPVFACTVALERDGEIVAGVTYNPITNDLYWAEKGKGAYHNDRRLRVSARKVMEDSLIATGLPFVGKTGHAQALKELHQIMQRTAGIRRLGACSLDLAMVAAGQVDGYWERGLKPWDMAAGTLLITEAGGKIGSLDGDQSPLITGEMLAANHDLYPQLLEKLQLAK
ncbi:inositol monophosphatase family protein [Asticcacaulis excentricus]|uniref:Inositol-1-monophosphatase n=4 Tax=Asticcacaulis TaxID=76890 RepID=E8RR64_ASTEC|nr:inositol monophosphatase family protein [Asticcacaulis excentricus]ADU13382.1 inositol monophosphatase [Asticcacaulis excentricus CB 48]BBF80486.1 inositol-1-monophosphatase [Asticcacaulis excentricus]